jgi:hypothetical protein
MLPGTSSRIGITHPNDLSARQWNDWKRKCIDSIAMQRTEVLRSITKLCGDGLPIDPTILGGESEEDFRARLEARIVRPKNFPLQEEA